MERMSESARQPSFALATARRVLPWLIVLGLWLLAGWTTLGWLAIDSTPPSWDPSVHLTHALYYWAYLTRMPLAEAYAGLGLTSLYYPPLVHVAGALAYLWCGVIQPTVIGLTTADVPVLANLAFMGLLLYGTYSLAARCYGEPAGLLAALLVACYPILAGQSRLYLLDYPLTACTVAAMALLAASDDLTHPGWVWPLGVMAGVAFLCKWSFLFLFAPVLVFALLRGVQRLRSGESNLTWIRLTFNAVVVLAGVLVIAGPWYLSHPGATIRELTTSNQTWLLDSDPGPFTLAGLTYYPRALLAEQIFLPFTLLFGFGALFHFVERDRLPGFGLLVTWLLAGGVVFWLVPNKDPRFTMPLLPAMAVLSASWLAPETNGRAASQRWRAVRATLLAVAVLLALAEHHVVAWRPPSLTARVGPSWAPLWSDHASLTNAPVRYTWPEEQLAKDIAAVAPPNGYVGILPNTAHLNYLTMRYYVDRQYLPYLLDTQRVPQVGPVSRKGEDGRPAAATIESLVTDGYDVLVTMDGDQGAHSDLLRQTVVELQARRQTFETAYRQVAERAMPGGEKVKVWLLRELDDQP